VHAVFYQVGFILILYGENNGNLKKNNNTYQVIYLLSLIFCMKLKGKYINYNIRFLKLLLYDLK
jgi:hypothetical protein